MKKIYCLLLILSFKSGAWTHLGSNTFGWKNSNLEFFVNSSNCSIPPDELNSIIDKALETWNHVPFSSLKLKRHDQPATDTEAQFRNQLATQLPLIVCSNQLSDYGDIDPNRILGFVPYFQEDQEGFVKYSGLVLNSQLGSNAELSQLERGEVELILAHEIGHVLGLGHSSDPNALMYFQLNKNFLLITQDDQDGIAHLYPENMFKGLLGCASVRSHANNNQSQSQASRTAFFFLLGAILFFFIRISSKKISKEPLP